ncbi:carbohydrate kinase family protein [Actinokineospora sp. UTMC 2448]|uniref:carbohydrate kinase family protein n=1 Tax=Actinokineospora sp. UTMC 2448 TaxID=2268449 RepID=UPI0021646DD2|nr:carbohydrate kinase family protein [Actinokineospora sp. UTMC 2448]UVS77953.1 putative sugar kinase YdjH [Actinokineospora sp. UTMC 2448]
MRVVVVGDTALDIVARPDGEVRHGHDTRASIALTAGGAGANTAAWLAHLGAEVTLVSRVGADAAAGQVRADLTALGVRCAFTEDPDASTGCVVVLVDGDGQRSMLPDRGANARLRPSDLSPDVLSGAAHLHLSGYVLLDESSREAGLHALAAARAAGLTTSVDPQAAALIEDAATFLEWVRGVDLLLPNADEMAVLGADVLKSVRAVAATAGSGGASWLDASGSVRVPAVAADCVDSTGAGDAFDAGVLTAWLGGAGPRAALAAGVAAGAAAVSRVGAQPVARLSRR